MKKGNGNQHDVKLRPVYRKLRKPRGLKSTGTVESVLSRARRRVSCMVEPELTRQKGIINHDDAGTDGRDEIVEDIERIGPR